MQKFSRKFSKTIWQKSETTTNSAIFGDPRWWTLAFLNELRVFCAAAAAAAAVAVAAAAAAALNYIQLPDSRIVCVCVCVLQSLSALQLETQCKN